MALQIVWSSCLFLFLLHCSLVSSSSQKAGSHIVYLGPRDESLHPDAITDSHYSLLTSVLGSSESAQECLIYSYKHGFSGFAAVLTDEQVVAISQLPNVVSVFPNSRKVLHTTDSWDFLGLSQLVDRSLVDPRGGRSIWKDSNYGKDVIIGSLDSGVWPESESYADNNMGPIPKKWKGSCQTGDAFNSSHCNRKLIGANYFHSGYDAVNGAGYIRQKKDYLSARDSGGHGTHTSSTAAGRFVGNASLFGYARGTAKGGAPLARVAIYKVCWPSDASGGECYDADILAAFDKGIHDGVDVFTLSLGSNPPLPELYQDATAIGAYHAVQRGIVVVCSAGNSGPDEGSVGNVAPWIITVAASSLDRSLTAEARLGNHAVFQGQTASPSKLEKRMYPLVASKDVYAASSNATDSELCLPGSLDRKKVEGKIVACLRGQNARVEKGLAVLQAGGAGMILCNAPENGDEIVADAHLLPALQISNIAGEKVFEYINSTRSPVAYIAPGVTRLNVKPAPSMAAFSSPGPNSLIPDLLKPDITAPGLNILAAYTEASSPTGLSFDKRKVKFNMMSGTSMSCPHVAGIAALIKAYHPDWSPAAIRSAIVTTGYQLDDTKHSIEDGSAKTATPFNFGGGHVNPNAAAHPGLVYDVTERDYIYFLCGLGYPETSVRVLTGDRVKCPRKAVPANQLNTPSITLSKLRGSGSVKRTVKNVGGHAARYLVSVEAPAGVAVSVEPKVLEFTKRGQELSYRVHFKVVKSSKGEYVFGSITWRDNKHTVRIPVAVNAFHSLTLVEKSA